MEPIPTQSDAELLASLRRAQEALPGAAPETIARAIALWPDQGLQGAVAATAAAASRLVRALLTSDSWAGGPMALRLRGAGPEALHHLVYTAEGRDIDVRIEALPAGYVVTGQLLGRGDRGELQLAPEAADAATAMAATDEYGEFRFAPLAAGRYRLTVHTGGLAIELPPIELGPRR